MLILEFILSLQTLCQFLLQLSSQDLAEVEEALETIGAKQRRLIIEEQELTELKEEMMDYEEDIQDFKEVNKL